MRFSEQPPVRARLDCGQCGHLLDKLEADPADPNHDARSVPPANPRRGRVLIEDKRTGQVLATITAAGTVTDVRSRPPLERDAGRGFEYRAGLYHHRYRCPCRADWQFNSDRLGAAVLAAVAAGRRRIVAGVDV
jgi:hypothetical protein